MRITSTARHPATNDMNLAAAAAAAVTSHCIIVIARDHVTCPRTLTSW